MVLLELLGWVSSKSAGKLSTIGTIDPLRHVSSTPPVNQNDNNDVHDNDDIDNEEFFKKELEMATLIENLIKRKEIADQLKKQQQQQKTSGQKPNSYASISMWKKYFHIQTTIETEETSALYETIVQDLASQPIQTQYAKDQLNLMHRTRFSTSSSTSTTTNPYLFGINNATTTTTTAHPSPFVPPPDTTSTTNSTQSNSNSNVHGTSNIVPSSSAAVSLESSVDYHNLIQRHEQRVMHQPNLSVGPDSIYLAQ